MEGTAIMNFPEDAIKDRFEGPDPDSCPECLHAKDECVCDEEKERIREWHEGAKDEGKLE
jgi:hypothetical protein